MGGAIGSCVLASDFTDWKLSIDPVAAKRKYVADKTLELSCSLAELELRALLESPIALRYLLSFTEEDSSIVLMRLWFDAVEGAKLDMVRKTRLEYLFEQYREIPFFTDSKTGLKVVFTVAERERELNRWLKETDNPMNWFAIVDSIYLSLHRSCFQQLFTQIYQPFMTTVNYRSLFKLICDPENWVTANSFQYMNVIAQGSFGLVLRCRKKTTGIDYAMKIQPKANQLRQCRKNKRRVMTEMQAYTLCDHPYVTKLAYATQTSTLTMLVMPIAGCGDFNQCLAATEHGYFSVSRVRFYAAEIVSALIYLHNCSIIYRDLKPGNILLHSDGHIMLADLGSVADVNGNLEHIFNEKVQAHEISGICRESVGVCVRSVYDGAVNGDSPSRMNVFHSEYVGDRNQNNSCDVDALPRTKSLVGTTEYMAPEIILLFGQRVMHKDGYTAAVDWWSLGILIYKLLVGEEPFSKWSVNQIGVMLQTQLLAAKVSYQKVFSTIFGEVKYSNPVFTPDIVDFLKGLLTFDPSKRLGGQRLTTTVTASECPLRNHEFFTGIDWTAIESKTFPPPYQPIAEVEAAENIKTLMTTHVHEHLIDKLSEIGRIEWADDDLEINDYVPNVGVMTSVFGVPFPHSVVNPSTTLLSKNDSMAPREYKVEEEDQGYFYGWNYASASLVETL